MYNRTHDLNKLVYSKQQNNILIYDFNFLELIVKSG